MALRDELIKEIELRLGGQMVDVELDPEHYDMAIKKSFENLLIIMFLKFLKMQQKLKLKALLKKFLM